jgi:hypothetical protein
MQLPYFCSTQENARHHGNDGVVVPAASQEFSVVWICWLKHQWDASLNTQEDFLKASTPLLRTIPKWISFEQPLSLSTESTLSLTGFFLKQNALKQRICSHIMTLCVHI